MMTTATYTYSVAITSKDQNGVVRALCAKDIASEEVDQMDLGEFQGADDLPDGVDFADGLNADGISVRVFRTHP